MTPDEELFAIADSLEAVRVSADLAAAEEALAALDSVAAEAARAFSGSWLGYHSHVYYAGLKPPPPRAHFSQEWGLMDMSVSSLGSRGDWREYDPNELQACLRAQAGDPSLLDAVHAAAGAAEAEFGKAKADIRSILLIEKPDNARHLPCEINSRHGNGWSL